MKHTKTRYDLRCSQEELKAWHEAAARRGVKLSVYIRMLLNNKPKPSASTPPSPELLRQLAAIGNNLNQLSRFANTYKKQADIKSLSINNVSRTITASKHIFPQVEYQKTYTPFVKMHFSLYSPRATFIYG